MRRHWILALAGIVWLAGVLCGWVIGSTPVRAAQAEWHLAASDAPGILFWRYSTSGEVQACASTQREGEFECRRLTLSERDARAGR